MKSPTHRPPLRVVVCGSVGDGKSTLIGLLGDASRAFAEPSVRDLVTEASRTDVAVVVVDAGQGVLTQTRRYSYLAASIGIGHVVLAVNKIDAVGYSREAFERIAQDFRAFARQIGIEEVACIPVSALAGDNVAATSANMPWYQGPTLMKHLAAVEPCHQRKDKPFRMPVQAVDGSIRGFVGVSGIVAAGCVKPDDAIRVLPSGRLGKVARIVADGNADVAEALPHQSVTLTLEGDFHVDEVGVGDVLSAADAPPEVADQFEAMLVWTGDEHLLPGRPYLMRIGAKTIGMVCSGLKYKINVTTLDHVAAKTLEPGEIAVCNVSIDRPIPFDPYKENRDTGGFTVLDRTTNATVGAGMLHFALRRSHNIHWQAIEVGKRAHAALKGQRPCILWFTGLSASGKSTIANLVEKKLHAAGHHTYLLDGDNVRHGLNKDLGFTEADRVENIRRVGEVAKLMADAGLIVLVSFISPFRAERQMARSLVEEGEFVEVFIDTPLEVAEKRDPKGLYEKARRGQLKNFTGIDSPYEPPEHPEVRIDTTALGAADAADVIVEYLRRKGATA